MPKTVSRQVFDALLPPGALWVPEPDEGLDQLLDGIADSSEDIANYLGNLANIRNPALTPILSDLEREYGIETDTSLLESTRRLRLETKKTKGVGKGGKDDLQDAIDSSGFTGVTVYENSPAVDPAIFLDQVFQMVAGGNNAYAGFIPSGGTDITAYAGRIGGELIVNGDVFKQTKAFTSQAGDTYAGGLHGSAGEFDKLNITKIEYDIPTDPNDWPLVFFVGGTATFNGDGSLASIANAEVERSREGELKRLILSIKPIHSWCGLIVTFI